MNPFTCELLPCFFSRLGRLAACLLLGTVTLSADSEDGWKYVTQSDDVSIYEKAHAGSDLLEFKGVGIIDVPPLVAKRVLDDVESYPKFMPYVTEAKIISREGHTHVSYQRISPPIVGDRDYTLRVESTSHGSNGGVAYSYRWRAASELGPAEKSNVTRIKTTTGSWTLEPEKEGRQTKATYTIYTESGGSLPTFIANTAGKTAVPRIFTAVRKQVQLRKYANE